MSLSRSPSPHRGGGWSTPGLADQSEHGNAQWTEYNNLNGTTSRTAANTNTRSLQSMPSFSTRNEGFFSRQRRKISATLPRFNSFNTDQKDWNAEKLGRGRWRPASGIKWGSLKTLIGNILRKFKILLIVLVLIPLTTILWTKTSQYRSESVKQMILSDSWCRHDCPLQASVLFRRWISFRYNTGSKPGRWRYGMERPS